MFCHRQKAIDLCTTRNIKISIACIIVSSIIINSPRFFGVVWDTSAYGKIVITDFGCSYGFQAGYMLWFTMAIRFLIPSVILAFTNIQLFREVNLSKLSRLRDQATYKTSYPKLVKNSYSKSRKLLPGSLHILVNWFLG